MYDELLVSFARAEVPVDSLEIKVKDLWQAERGWDWPLIEHLLPSLVLLKLTDISLPAFGEEQDEPMWGGRAEQYLFCQNSLWAVVQHLAGAKMARLEEVMETPTTAEVEDVLVAVGSW